MTNLFTLVGEILLRGTDEAQRDITDVTKAGEQAESKLSKAFKKIGAVVAGAFAIDKIKDFGVSIVNASAEVSAEMSAFEQIMGDYSDNAQAKLNEVADSTGVVSTRLTPYMTSLTAKFKGLGNDIDTSTDLAQRGLYLASDAAAFWDKSLDDSMSALNSFINGSYEGGEAIGLFANDTQLAQFAIQQGVVESTKDWSALDEATKQATRLEYAENMMKASGATGQAAKEAGQYANVQANLAEAWRQFKAQIGEPLLQNVVIPAMQGLQTVVGTLSDKWKQLTQWISDNKDTINQWIDILIIAGTVIGAYVLVAGTMSILQTVGTWIKSVATAQSLLNAVMAVNPIALVVAVLAGLVIAFIKAYNESETFRTKVNEVLTAVTGFFTNAWGAIKIVWDAVKPYFEQIWEGIKTAFSVAESVLSGFFTLAWNAIKIVWDVVESYFTTLWEAIKGVFKVVESVLSGDFKGAWDAIKGIWNAVEQYFKDVWEAVKKVFKVVDDVLGGFFSDAWKSIKKAWDSAGSWFEGIWKNIKNAFPSVANWFKEKFDKAWSNIKEAFANPTSFFTGVWDDIKGVFDPKQFFKIGEDLINGLWDGINGVKDWVVEKATGVWDTITGSAKKAFDEHSPSKVFAEIGKFLAEGLGIGIEENADYAVEAVEELGDETTSGFQGMMDKLQSWFSSNPVMRRIGQAFGFEFAEGIEEAIPEIESTVENIPEVVAEVIEDNSDTVTQSFGDVLKEMTKKVSDTANKIMGYLSDVGDAIYDYNNQQLENEISAKEAEIDALNEATEEKLNLAQTEHDETLNLLEDQYKNGLIEQEEYNKAKEQLATQLAQKTKAIQEQSKVEEERLAKEKQDIERRQFEAKKRNDIAQVWVNFASATMRAFAENWWPVALGITSALGVQAGIQTATINSQQYTPALAEGGIVDRSTYAQIGEDGAEAVVPLEKNTEWVGGLARAISPAVVASSQSSSEEVRTLREELVEIKTMLSEYLTKLLNKNTDVVIDGNSLASAIAPSIDTNLGTINRLRARGI